MDYNNHPNLNRLCHAENEYMQTHNNQWDSKRFQAWLKKKWGVRFVRSDFGKDCVMILDKNKYLLFLLAYSDQWSE